MNKSGQGVIPARFFMDLAKFSDYKTKPLRKEWRIITFKSIIICIKHN